MDTKILTDVSELKYLRTADRAFHYAPIHFSMEFTRKSKDDHDIYPYEAFTDCASRSFRQTFPRSDYIIQNDANGGIAKRGIQPRFRPTIEIYT